MKDDVWELRNRLNNLELPQKNLTVHMLQNMAQDAGEMAKKLGISYEAPNQHELFKIGRAYERSFGKKPIHHRHIGESILAAGIAKVTLNASGSPFATIEEIARVGQIQGPMPISFLHLGMDDWPEIRPGLHKWFEHRVPENTVVMAVYGVESVSRHPGAEGVGFVIDGATKPLRVLGFDEKTSLFEFGSSFIWYQHTTIKTVVMSPKPDKLKLLGVTFKRINSKDVDIHAVE